MGKRRHLLEEIEYKPMPVKETLRKMKDLTSLMADLGFYAYLSGDPEIAKVVQELEEEVEKLSYHLIMNAVLAARDGEEAEAASLVIKVSEALCYAANAAADIATIPLSGIQPPEIVKKAIEKAEEIISSVQIKAGSKLCGKRPADFEKLGIYADVLALKRGNKWLIVGLHDVDKVNLRAGDTLVVRGNDVALRKLREVSEGGGS